MVSAVGQGSHRRNRSGSVLQMLDLKIEKGMIGDHCLKARREWTMVENAKRDAQD